MFFGAKLLNGKLMRFGKLSGRFEESFFEKMLDPMDSREAATIIL